MPKSGPAPFPKETDGFVDLGGVRLRLSNPNETTGQWIGQHEVLNQLLACWLVVDEKDLPLAPRLVGAPGIGKTALGMAGARQRDQDLYIYQCTAIRDRKICWSRLFWRRAARLRITLRRW